MFRIAGFRCIRPFGLRGKERPIHAPVSPAPSKIPYGGFSPVRLQTSIRVPPSSAQRRLIDTFLPRRWSPAFLVRLLGLASHPNAPNADSESLVQWPLAPRPVLLSSRLNAYYGHIRDSGAPPRLMDSSATLLKRQRFPNLLCLSFGMCRLPYPGGSDDFIRLFIHRRCCFHPIRRDSTTALPGQSGPA